MRRIKSVILLSLFTLPLTATAVRADWSSWTAPDAKNPWLYFRYNPVYKEDQGMYWIYYQYRNGSSQRWKMTIEFKTDYGTWTDSADLDSREESPDTSWHQARSDKKPEITLKSLR